MWLRRAPVTLPASCAVASPVAAFRPSCCGSRPNTTCSRPPCRSDFPGRNSPQRLPARGILCSGRRLTQAVRPYGNVVVTSVFVCSSFSRQCTRRGNGANAQYQGLVACSDGTQNNLTRVSKREDEAESEQQWTRIISRMNEQVPGSSFLTKSPRTILNMASLPTRYVKSLFCWTNSS